MSLQERLLSDMQTAMRAGDVVRRDTIRLLRAAIRNAEIEMQRDAADEDVLQIISRQVKQRNESIEMFQQGGRDDLVAAEEAQKAILEEYLPRQLSQQEIEQAVREVVADLGATDMRQMGAVMREAMDRLKGRADGRVVNQVVREILSH
jgi:uncharacterized protein